MNLEPGPSPLKAQDKPCLRPGSGLWAWPDTSLATCLMSSFIHTFYQLSVHPHWPVHVRNVFMPSVYVTCELDWLLHSGRMGKHSSNIYLPELIFLFLLFILAQVRMWTGPVDHVWACSVRGSSVWPNMNQSPVQRSQILGKNLTKPTFGTTTLYSAGLAILKILIFTA